MRIVPAFFASGEEFLRDYRAAAPEFDGPALLLRTKIPFAVGEDVVVEVGLPRLPNRVRVVGQIAGPGPGGRGVWVVMPGDDRPSLDFVVAHARKFVGSAIPRHHERFPVTLPCDWRVTGQERVASTTEDLSAGGAFVRALAPPEVGKELTIVLSGTTTRALVLHGQVIWVRRSDGVDRASGGMGVRFAAPTVGDARQLREMLRRASERGRLALSV
jgi:Tfp pilus assembly protein PilZ